MADKVSLAFRDRNPDVLTSIANLSNDEVFTPPQFANEMLDAIERAWADDNSGAIIWQDSKVKFLDPFTKSGVFLREITRRLSEGLAEEFPDLQQRVDHITKNQVFGIAVTRLTSLLARRSVYCSKDATGKHSISRAFTKPEGNIWFEPVEHTWEGGTTKVITADDSGNPVEKSTNGKCKYCRASQLEYDRSAELDSYAYALIHQNKPASFIQSTFGANVKFDVIIGNPPYQLSTGSSGGAGVQAKPIYQLFVEQAKKLEPRFLCMVTPSRWFAGGMGLDAFRESMLADNRLRAIHDFPDSNDVFPGTQIKGGVSYFVWDRDNPGKVLVNTYDDGKLSSTAERVLKEPGTDVFIRYNQGVGILKKVISREVGPAASGLSLPEAKQFMRLVSSIGAFGLDTLFKGSPKSAENDIRVYRNGGIGYVSRNQVPKNSEAIDWWKVFIPPAGSGSDAFPHPILGKPFLGEPGSISSWTYMHIGPFSSESEAKNAISYIATRFFRFLVLLHKPTQHATRSVYTFVPLLDFSRPWSDEDLFARYGLTAEEVSFIESMVRPMELDND